jgi:hypothetical protein
MKDVYFERDWDEAIAINHQLSIAGEGVTAQHIIDLNRFCDCSSDDEGYDVPKDRMKSLKAAGLVAGGHRGYYGTTDLGSRVYGEYFLVNRSLKP